MAYIVYYSSLVFSLALFPLKRIKIFSPLSVFLLFSLLYSVFPYLAFLDEHPVSVGVLPLLNRRDLIEYHLLNVGLSIFAFSICYIYGLNDVYKKIRVNGYFSTGGTQIKRTTKSENLILIIFVLVAVYTLILGYIYPWGGWGGEFGRPELINSLLGNSKIFLAVVISYFFINRGFSFITFLLFSCLLIITFVEGSRTTLSTLIIAMLIITAGNGLITIRRLLFLVAISLSAFITIIFIALSRIGISLNDLSLFEALYPLYIEGMYGSYMCLQIYDLVWVKEVMSPTWGVHLVMDPFLFLIPRALLSLFGIDKDSLTIYSDWSTRASSFLDDPLAPYGGFYFIADAFVAFTFLGPLLIGGLFGFITGYIEKYGTRSFKGKYVYIL